MSKQKIKILAIIGARPQFIKHAALLYECKSSFEDRIDLLTLHTGQHYDAELNDIFFQELNMALPEYRLQIGSKSHPTQIAEMMLGIEKTIVSCKPHCILVYGDTNSTLAGGLVSAKMNIPLTHVEAGLRSQQMDMPEEVNRIITDRISNLLFCPSKDAIRNLDKEAIQAGVVVGDIMKDMIRYVPLSDADVAVENYIYSTIHRPSNTDDPDRLQTILNQLNDLPVNVVFSLHPRTKKCILRENFDLKLFPNISFISPVGYFRNIAYINGAQCLITDSGGMQKESYWCKTPCITVRHSTEWKETMIGGWNQLVEPDDISTALIRLNPDHSAYSASLYGEGDTAHKILSVIVDQYSIAL